MFSIAERWQCSEKIIRYNKGCALVISYMVCYIESATNQQKYLTQTFWKRIQIRINLASFSYTNDEVIVMNMTKIPQGDEVLTVELTVKELIALTGVRFNNNHAVKISATKKLNHVLEQNWKQNGSEDSYE